MKDFKHIALVGCGFTGTSAFFQLVDSYPVTEITIFEASGDFGPGYAYRTDECPDYLINNTTDTMCLVPSNRRAFWNWVQTRPDLVADAEEKGHLPRTIFGHFLKDAFQAALMMANIKNITVNLVPHAVTGMREDKDGLHLVWGEGQTTADVAVLTTGRSVEYQPFPKPPKDGATCFTSHISEGGLDELALDATVHVMGASLSAYDVLNRLFSPTTGCRFERNAAGELDFIAGANQRHVVMGSRSGRLKSMQSRHPAKLDRQAFAPARIRDLAKAGQLDLAALGKLIVEEAANHNTDLDISDLTSPYDGCDDSDAVNVRAIARLEGDIARARGSDGSNFLVDLFGAAQVDIWDIFAEHLLPADQEAIYRKSVETAVLCHGAPCPVPTAEKILALMRAGRLRLITGVGDVTLDTAGRFQIAHGFGVETADILVNTIGAVNRDVTDPGQDALTRDLVNNGHLRAYQREGVILPGAEVDMVSFCAEGANRIYVANMMLWGPGFFTSSAFMMATIVERLLSGLFSDETP